MHEYNKDESSLHMVLNKYMRSSSINTEMRDERRPPTKLNMQSTLFRNLYSKAQ